MQIDESKNEQNSYYESRLEFLSKLEWLSGLSDQALIDFSASCQEYTFERGAILLQEEDIVNSLYIIREGQVESFITDRNGRYLKQRTFSAGARFSDLWLFEQLTCPTTVRARRPGRYIEISSAAFIRFVQRHRKALDALYPFLSPEAQDEIDRSRFQNLITKQTLAKVMDANYVPYDTSTLRPQILEEVDAPTVEEVVVVTSRGRRKELAQQTTNGNTEVQLEAERRERAKRYSAVDMLPDEFVEFDTRRSTKILTFRLFIRLLVLLFLVALPPLFATLLETWSVWVVYISAGVAILPILNFLMVYINWRNCFFLITNKRLIRYELEVLRFRTNVEKIPFEQVQSVEVETANFITNMLRIGTAKITTAAQTGVVYFDYIDNPKEVQSAINKIRDRNRLLTRSKMRAELRRSLEDIFQIDAGVTPVREPDDRSKPKKRGKRTSESWYERNFGRARVAEGIMYHKHPIELVRVMVPPTIMGIVLIIAYYSVSWILAVPFNGAMWLLLMLLVAANFVWVVWLFEDWRNDTFLVTNQFVVDVDRAPFGFGESRKQAELVKVQNVRTEQEGFLPSFFNYGNVHIETAGADANIVFENVRTPRKIQDDIFSNRSAIERRFALDEEKRTRNQYALLIDEYLRLQNQGEIRKHNPLPALDDEGE